MIALVAALLTGCCNLWRPLPDGLSYLGEARPAASARFLHDLTYLDTAGERRSDQMIFEEMFSLIRGARQLVVLDMFLYNDFVAALPDVHRPLCEELTTCLVTQKRMYPELRIVLITDPINTVYGGFPAPHLERLRAAGVEVIVSKLSRLRDSNPLYSCFWRPFVQPFGNGPGQRFPNPFGRGRVSLRSYLSLLNFKANHRKVLIADRGGDLVGMVTSANPHDGSSAHTNIALVVTGRASRDLLRSEEAVVRFSAPQALPLDFPVSREPALVGGISVQVLTEKAILDAVISALGQVRAGDRVELIMFYLSERRVIRALLDACRRGGEVRVVLDPNKDAFGRAKSGIPNRQVARELMAGGMQVRWYDTHGEQCHAKMLVIRSAAGHSFVTLGSANFTRRNLRNLNLETNVAVRGASEARVFVEALAFFEGVWSNRDGMHCTVPYEQYEDHSIRRRLLYRFQEATGLSTF
ncbi:MAG: phospholipase [Lentisphaerae bacterium]|nr:phospholipase [Lentisphaerota bacterium]MBT4816651.1 phospholipase [Lentisphaerota bacterium]MBT5610070.1 phospholipase [Lentisphaerota bacterium]MBT7055530.1 phospholipase [Lentisphaerota bacterium]MBT7841515.1 phospholipase [Lentisphaerota bacterium]